MCSPQYCCPHTKQANSMESNSNQHEREREQKTWFIANDEMRNVYFNTDAVLYYTQSIAFVQKKNYRTRENAIRKRDGPCQKLLKLYDFIILIR